MMANESPNPANSVDHQLYWFDPLFKPCTSHRNSPNKRNHETSIPASLFWTLHFSLLLQLLKAVNKRQESLRKELSNEIIGHRETQISLENLRSTLGSYILEIEFAERQISLEEELLAWPQWISLHKYDANKGTYSWETDRAFLQI